MGLLAYTPSVQPHALATMCTSSCPPAAACQALAAQAAVSPRQRDAAAWLQSEAASTLAVFELGGASMQVEGP